ncbi:MAG: FecR domain-containing protein [Candidatus Aminicenantes bacterium]|nr:MAG: FecR domain-containing protein [Candidatus Aminicenantes bacterium]
MRKLAVFSAFLAFLVSFAFSSPEEEYYSYSYAHLSYVKGDVYIQRAEDLGYESGVVNLPVVEGDKLGTREGRAEIHFGRKNYLRIDSHTQIDFAKLPQRGNDQIKLHLLSGNVYLRISVLDREKDFEIHTPDASFYILEEGLYRFDIREEASELFVFEGSVEAAGEEASLLVSSEERVTASGGYFNSDPVRFYASLDDSFSGWSRSRDALHSRAVARRYLPAELDEYEVELADNGRWVNEQPYGYVWVPYVVHHDWRPYYYGRWVWYPIIGWNWVSYDPWGWCVYHYGRWHWRLGLGWHWIPTRIWGPAWVHWWHGYDYIGWCPLSYYGHPAVIINNRFYGRYYHRHYPLNSRVLTVVHKRQLQARHVSKVALSQKRVSRLGKISLSAKQPNLKPNINRSSPQAKKAANVLSRSNIRKVGKGYVSGKAGISSSRLKSTGIKSVSRFSRASSSKAEKRIVTRRGGKILSPSGSISRTSLTRTYPSRRASPSSRQRSFSSSSSGKVTRSISLSSERKKVSRGSSSIKGYASRSTYSTPRFGSSRRSIRSDSNSTSRDRMDSSRIRQNSPRSYRNRLSTAQKRSLSGLQSSSSRSVTPRIRNAPSSRGYSSPSITSRSSRSSKRSSPVSSSRSFSRARSFSSRSASPSRIRSRTSSSRSPSRSISSSSRVRSSSGSRSVSSRSSSVKRVKKK